MAGTDNQPDEAHRLRPHPEARFAPPQHQFDLRAVARQLEQEHSAPRQGHRQTTLYRQGLSTVALFRFEAGAALADHSAAGTVTIHVIEGRMRVTTPEAEYLLSDGNLAVLAPATTHSVQAEEPTIMLLQVHLVQPAAGAKE
jgi:quercetin dioxygenase-like cupin family protein